ncbi:MurR/RpiR family transcriptional regulator [Thalassobacillus sp. CUG 92003]|uniref:MurR/RpiR family transcriptional regulator n=1 Tax=Thalassobacillus sp. CUG 92003 TaxID=2736641 RepID=UPI0015E70B2D|nr:MurR/RpiR family transcriptional regulator [Thalassobacillus sp. CUG 92003]
MESLFSLEGIHFTPKQRKIANVVEKQGASIVYHTEKEIADQSGVSVPTVSRFWPLIGYSNFKVFKHEMKSRIAVTPENKFKNFAEQMDENQILNRLIEHHFKNLVQTGNHLNKEHLQKSIESICNASDVYIYAPASSEGLGNLLEYRLKRFGIRIELIAKSGFEIYESMLHMSSSSTLIVFQFVDMLLETQALFEHANSLGVKIILITDQLVSNMYAYVDYFLYTHRGEMWEFHTMVAPIAVLESMVMGVGLELKEVSLERLKSLSDLRKAYKHLIPK